MALIHVHYSHTYSSENLQTLLLLLLLLFVHGHDGRLSKTLSLATQAMTQLRDNLQEVIKSLLPPQFQFCVQAYRK